MRVKLKRVAEKLVSELERMSRGGVLRSDINLQSGGALRSGLGRRT